MKTITLFTSDGKLELYKKGAINIYTLKNKKYWGNRIKDTVSVKLRSKNDKAEFFIIRKSLTEDGFKLVFGSRVDDKLEDELTIAVTYSALMINDVVFGLSVDMEDAVKKSKYFKQNIKHTLKRVVAERRRFENMMYEIINTKADFFADVNERYYEQIKPSLNIFKLQIYQEMLNNKVPDANIFTQVEATRTMAEFAVINHKQHIEQLRQKIGNEANKIDYLTINNLYSIIDNLSDIMVKQIKETANLNTPNVKMAFDILSRKMNDCNTIAKAIKM